VVIIDRRVKRPYDMYDAGCVYSQRTNNYCIKWTPPLVELIKCHLWGVLAIDSCCYGDNRSV
jgi:hypothetical protein